MVSSKPWVTMAPTLGPFSSMRALVPNVVAYRTESTSDRTRSRFRPARLQARSRASLKPRARLWWVVKALASMYCSSQTKKQSVNVPPISTEMRFMVVVSCLAQRLVGIVKVVLTHPAHPPFGVQVDEQVLSHRNSHGRVAFRS